MKRWITLFLGAWTGMAAAGLQFDHERVAETARPEAESHDVVFHFTNTGKAPVTIREVETYCGCISGSTDKTVYQPGEKGTVKAVFRLGSFEGEVNKGLCVHSDSPENPDQQLVVSITIPKMFEIVPEVTTWLMGDPLTPKTIKFRNLTSQPVTVLRTTSTREAFKAEIKEVEKGKEYEITVTPGSTGEPVLGALRIETDCAIAKYRSRMCFFNVLRKAATTPAPGAGAPAATGAVEATAPAVKQKP